MATTAKCSDCKQLVPIDALVGHLCDKQPPRGLLNKIRDQQSQKPPLHIVTVPSPHNGPLDQRHSPMNHVDQRPPPPSPHMPYYPYQLPNTQSGGEAGMAGVGRRGFHAVAQAALFAANHHPHAPPFLTINPHLDPYRATPPLSPHSANSPHSPHSPALRSPLSATTSVPLSRTPSPGTFAPPQPPHTPVSDRSMTPDNIKSATNLPFFQKFKNKTAAFPSSKSDASLLSPQSPNDSEFSGLAYDDDTPLSPKSPSLRPSKSDSSAVRPATLSERFPSLAKQTKSEPKSPAMTTRSLSSASSYSSRTTSRSLGALDRTMETLFEDPLSPTSPDMPLSTPGSPPAKVPTRSRTAPASSSTRNTAEPKVPKKPKVRVCVKCDKHIEDGRWIRAEGAGVLCERCWKLMYLPKCRRCNRPIEKHAISSADGQLKGKYHKECFTCYSCKEPFPDKEFYVFDDQPYCRYHYHEANDSLCAAPTCGQPIEGACAVAHSGERYHPEHLSCQFVYTAGGSGDKRRCQERLEEYWEIDGLMLCERHALRGDGKDVKPDEHEVDRRSSRAMKRVTRFIDLR